MLCKTLEEPCVHYWLIETPDGPTSRGVCRWCGEEREFWNYIEAEGRELYAPVEVRVKKLEEKG